MDTAAYSIDGRTFVFRGEASAGLQPGEYVTLDPPDAAPEQLGQVLEVHAVPGASFAEPAIEGSGVLLGSRSGRGTITNASLRTASTDVVADRVSRLGEAGLLRLGSLADNPDVPAPLIAKGLGRHTFVCGQSGAGKTYAMGKILERVLQDTDLRLVVVDPNSDYVHLGEMLPREETGLSAEAYAKADSRRASYADRVKVLSRNNGLKLWLGNLAFPQQATVLGLDPIEDAEETDVARLIIEGFGNDPFTPADIRRRAQELEGTAARRLALRIGNLGLDRMEIWADADNPPAMQHLGDDWRAAVVDLGSLTSPAERSIVSAALVLALWRRRAAREPVLLVIDEAHNLCPQHPMGRQQTLATDYLVTIAGEGRKYGIYLMVATQRPTKVHDNVLSQCDNLLLMRMNSQVDIAHLESVFSSVPPALLRKSSTFQLGEGLAFGKIAPDPLLFKTGRRLSPEGGVDVPSTWVTPA